MRTLIIGTFVSGLVACSNPAETAPEAATCEAASAPLGVSVSQSFPDLVLPDCADVDQRIDLLRCEHDVTLLSIGAGWCEPCKEETPGFQETWQNRQDERLGIVQVMFQDARGQPAGTLFCEQWTTEFGITFPVLTDPLGATLAYFDQAQAPLNVLVDRQGVVVWSANGKIDDLDALIDQYLP